MMRIPSPVARWAALVVRPDLGFGPEERSAASGRIGVARVEPTRAARKPFARRWFLSFVVTAGVVAAAVSWFSARSSMIGAGVAARPPAVPVTVERSRRADVPVYLWGIANVQAYNTVTIRPQVDGQLVEVAFKEGQQVRAGDLLLRVDPRRYQANVDQAVAKKAQDEAQLRNARRDLQRYAKLVENNHVTRQVFEAAEARVAQFEATVKADEAAIALAQINLDYTSIRSPLDGKVGIRLVDVGNIVRANDSALVTITQTTPISVVFTLPETALSQIIAASSRQPLPVAVFGQDGKEQYDFGELILLDNAVDQSTGTIRLKATLPNTAGLLWPGQFVNARLHVRTLKQALTIPVDAIQNGIDGSFTYIVEADGKVAIRKLSVATITDGLAVIDKGLADDAIVVTSGQYRLQPGARVEVEERRADNIVATKAD
jgi:multidrug efflux system membrane fusion protein